MEHQHLLEQSGTALPKHLIHLPIQLEQKISRLEDGLE